MTDRVHIPLIVQPRCCAILSSFRYARTCSHPAVGLPAKARSAFRLSIQRTTSMFCMLPAFTWWSPSWIGWISSSSTSALVPLSLYTSNHAAFVGPLVQCHVLAVIPLLIFDLSMYSWYVSLLICCIQSLFWLLASSSLLVESSSSGMCGSEWLLASSSWLLSQKCSWTRSVTLTRPIPGWWSRLDGFNSTMSRSLHGWESGLKCTCMRGLL